MLSGSLDYQLKMWDFLSMNQNLRPFKDFKPFDGYPVNSLSWSPSSDFFLCCVQGNQAKIFQADGTKKQTTIRGDMYLHDMNNTKGHVATIHDGKWNPKSECLFMTCSQDGTLRQWDLNSKPVGMDQNLAHQLLIKARDQRGQKTQILTLAYYTKGDGVVAGCGDGSI